MTTSLRGAPTYPLPPPLQEYLRYATFDVLEPMWGRMEVAMRKATNADQVGGEGGLGAAGNVCWTWT